MRAAPLPRRLRRLARYAAVDRAGRLRSLVATGPVAPEPADGPNPPPDPADTAPVQRLPEPPPPAERTPQDQTLPPPDGGVPFTIPIGLLEGWETSDYRYITPGALGRRDLPMTLMCMVRNPDGGWGHDAAIVLGRIDTCDRFDASAEVNRETGEPYGAGVFAWRATGYLTPDPNVPESVAAAGYIADGTLRGISVDLGEVVSEVEAVALDEDGFPSEIRENILEGSIVNFTVCPAAAFPGATIVTGDAPAEVPVTPEAPAGTEPAPAPVAASALPPVARPGEAGVMRITGDDCAPCAAGRTALRAAGGPEAPPAAWFARPEPDELTPWTVLDTGECFGHLAPWDVCHTGVGNACVTAPRGEGGYGLFHTGAIVTAEGSEVPVGHITLGGGHADVRLGLAPAIAHYDESGAAVADVTAVDGRHGIWLSGAVRPEASDTQVRQLRAHALSGDWRADARGGPLRLVAALCVNVPGFPVPRTRVASGSPLAMVAAGSQIVEARRRAAAGGTDAGAVEAAINRALAPVLASAARVGLARLTRR